MSEVVVLTNGQRRRPRAAAANKVFSKLAPELIAEAQWLAAKAEQMLRANKAGG
jgi:hypothetical protein